MNFTILWNVPFFKCKRQLLIKQKYFQNPNMIKFKNLMTSKNRKELTNMGKLIKEINKGVCVLQARISYLLCKYCKYCLMTLYISIPYCNLQWFMRIKKKRKRISYIWEIHITYSGNNKMMLYIKGKFTVGKLKLSLLC
jgi:hypothetical protein